MAERLRRTRLRRAGGYSGTRDLIAARSTRSADALYELDLERVVAGELHDFSWQVETFGFHGLSLEVRQHSAVHRPRWLRRDGETIGGGARGNRRRGARDVPGYRRHPGAITARRRAIAT